MCKEAVVVLALYLLGENEESHAHCHRIAGVWAEITKFEMAAEMRDFRLPPGCRWDLPPSGILHSVQRSVHTDVSGQSFGPIFQDVATLLQYFLTSLLDLAVLDAGTDRLSRNVGTD